MKQLRLLLNWAAAAGAATAEETAGAGAGALVGPWLGRQ